MKHYKTGLIFSKNLCYFDKELLRNEIFSSVTIWIIFNGVSVRRMELFFNLLAQ